jgi:hypothetical protein
MANSSTMLNDWKNRLIYGWGFMRILRLVIASIILVQAWQISEPMFAVFGGFILFQALLNIGCCGVSGCDINQSNEKFISGDKSNEITTFTEIK